MTTIDTQYVVGWLNDLHTLAPETVSAIVSNRTPCDERLAKHPTVVVESGDDGYRVGLVGVLNGLLASAGDDHVGWCYDDDTGALTGFAVVKQQRQEAPR